MNLVEESFTVQCRKTIEFVFRTCSSCCNRTSAWLKTKPRKYGDSPYSICCILSQLVYYQVSTAKALAMTLVVSFCPIRWGWSRRVTLGGRQLSQWDWSLWRVGSQLPISSAWKSRLWHTASWWDTSQQSRLPVAAAGVGVACASLFACLSVLGTTFVSVCRFLICLLGGSERWFVFRITT